MKVFKDLNDITDIEPTVVALGNFDGVHMGHQELIRRCAEAAKTAGVKSAVFTFSNHPRNLMRRIADGQNRTDDDRGVAKSTDSGDVTVKGGNEVKNIIYPDVKEHIMESLGVDYVFDIPFTDEVRTMSPEDFVNKLLISTFKMREAYCGFNYRFGFKGAGTPEMLAHMGIEQGFGVHVLSPVTIDGNVVSSTLIRQLIEEGRMEECAKYMGRTYSVEGEVVVGNRLGKTIGFPTSNLNIDLNMVSPPNGVYITTCEYGGKTYGSITNVGNKPTIGEFVRNIETHIFDFDKELYGKNIRVNFIKRVRPEIKFDSIDALKKQITEDCIAAKAFHRTKMSDFR